MNEYDRVKRDDWQVALVLFGTFGVGMLLAGWHPILVLFIEVYLWVFGYWMGKLP